MSLLCLFGLSEGHAGELSEKMRRRFALEVDVLTTAYSMLGAMCLVTLLIRCWAARRFGLPLRRGHVGFLLLMLALSSLRVGSFRWRPSPCVVEEGEGKWLRNLLGSAPMMVSFSIFMVLIYNVIIVLHSVHLAYEPLLRGQSSFYESHAARPPCSLPQPSRRPTLLQGTLSRVRACAPTCTFWIVMWGRPHSLAKGVVILLNVVMWAFYVCAYLHDFFNHFRTFLLLFYLPSIVISVTLGVCFIVSGVVLLKRLRYLRRLCPPAACSAVGGGEGGGGSGGDVAGRSGGTASAEVAPGPLRHSSTAAAASAGGGGGEHSVLARSTSRSMDSPSSRSKICVAVETTEADTAVGQQQQHPRSHLSISRTCSGFAFKSTSIFSASAVDPDFSVEMPSVEPVLRGLRRMLIVVSACVVAFLWRALVISFVWVKWNLRYPVGLSMLYFGISEVIPITLLLILYLIPGMSAIRFGMSVRGTSASLRQSTTPRGSAVESVPLPNPTSSPLLAAATAAAAAPRDASSF